MENNKNLVEDLKQYFQNTSREQILADWKKSEEFDQIGRDWKLLEPDFGQVLEKTYKKNLSQTPTKL